jgi:hypothetical protein
MKLRLDARVIVATVDSGTLVLLVIHDDAGVYWAYGCDDWRDCVAPSFGWDEDGDLRQHDGTDFYGAVWAEREGTTEELLVAWGDVAANGVLVAA